MDAARRRLLFDGVIAGVIGYLVVASFFALWNLLQGLSPIYTASLLGEALFAGLRDPAAVTLDIGLAIAFNGIHLIALEFSIGVGRQGDGALIQNGRDRLRRHGGRRNSGKMAGIQE